MPEKKVRIPNISCPHCVKTIRRELSELEGIESVEADPAAKEATIRWRAPLTWESIRRTLEDMGYPPVE
ncbi:MAG: heavy-metal-associated domain-containing protein [Candidatus Latescibacterota bacterium]